MMLRKIITSLLIFLGAIIQGHAMQNKTLQDKIVIITGASRGIGRAIALHLANQPGYKVYAGVRQLDSDQEWPKTVCRRILDVTDENHCQAVVNEIITREGRIDVLINNAGQGIFGSCETIGIEEAQRLFDINLFGAMRMINAVLPSMRAQSSGRILNTSSIAGFRPGLGWDLYNSSKFAIEGLSESLAATLTHWNIFVSIIEPGPVSTNFADHSTRFGTRFDGHVNPYQPFIHNAALRMKKILSKGQSPQEVAEFIQTVLEAERPHVRYQTSPYVQEVAAEKLVDPTGNKIIDKQREMVESLWATPPNDALR